jgi:hydroxymethylpyrimidine/phosphomethylpyrimidine kinase
MALSGLDPTGGAGIQADMEAIASMGCHTLPLITALTVQDTRSVHRTAGVAPELLAAQIDAVLADMPVAVCKVGLMTDVRVVEVIRTVFAGRPEIPLVVDPVLAAGNGDPLNGDEVRTAIRTSLVPLATVLTPNSLEARELAPEAEDLDAAAQMLMHSGAEFVLITGTHEAGPTVVNTLYGNRRRLDRFEWERLPHAYHGSGCTLAAAIAGLLGHGREPLAAIHEAQQYTWETLKHGYRIGHGQHMPNRLFWARGTGA